MSYIWTCMRLQRRRPGCDTTYKLDFWGVQFRRIVSYFKDPKGQAVGSMQDLHDYLERCTDPKVAQECCLRVGRSRLVELVVDRASAHISWSVVDD